MQSEKLNHSIFGFDIFTDEPWLKDQLELFSNQNAQLINSIPEQELERVSGAIERGLQQGSRFTEIAKEIQKSFGISKRRATLIARDQTTKLNASLTKLRQTGVGVTKYEWQTSGDERVRSTHRANDGKIFEWDKPSKITGHPGHDVNCFPGDLEFSTFDIINKMFRYRYRGQLAELITNDGLILKATPNHPILTQRGWIAIKYVNIGDNIISASNQTFNAIEMNINKNKSIFRDCFETIDIFFGTCSSAAYSGKFHGDFADDNVDIISFDCQLPNTWNVSLLQDFKKFILTLSDINFPNIDLTVFRSIQSAFNGLIISSQSYIGGCSKFFSIFNSCFRHSQFHSLRSISWIDSFFNQSIIYDITGNFITFSQLFDTFPLTKEEQYFFNRQFFKIMRMATSSIDLSINPPTSQSFADYIGIDSNFNGDFAQIESLNVKRHCVINKSITNFFGHVYNLETNKGYYSISENNVNLVVSNCRCVAIPIIEGI